MSAVGIAAISIGALLRCVALYALVMTIMQSYKETVIKDMAKKEGLIPPNPMVYEKMLSTNELVRPPN